MSLSPRDDRARARRVSTTWAARARITPAMEASCVHRARGNAFERRWGRSIRRAGGGARRGYGSGSRSRMSTECEEADGPGGGPKKYSPGVNFFLFSVVRDVAGCLRWLKARGRKSHATVCRGSPPRPSVRQRCSAREGRPRVALGPGRIAFSQHPLRSVSPQERRSRSPERAGSRGNDASPARVIAWRLVSPHWRACFMLRPAGGSIGVITTRPSNRGEWMPGSSPRPAPHAAPLGHSLSGRRGWIPLDGVSALGRWRDRCAQPHSYYF